MKASVSALELVILDFKTFGSGDPATGYRSRVTASATVTSSMRPCETRATVQPATILALAVVIVTPDQPADRPSTRCRTALCRPVPRRHYFVPGLPVADDALVLVCGHTTPALTRSSLAGATADDSRSNSARPPRTVKLHKWREAAPDTLGKSRAAWDGQTTRRSPGVAGMAPRRSPPAPRANGMAATSVPWSGGQRPARRILTNARPPPAQDRRHERGRDQDGAHKSSRP